MLDLFVEFFALVAHGNLLEPRNSARLLIWSPDGKRAGMGICSPALCQFKRGARTIEAALLGLVLERRNFAVTRPKLYVMPVNELLGAFLGGVIVGTD